MTAGLDPGGCDSGRVTSCQECSTLASRNRRREEGCETWISRCRRHACNAEALLTFGQLDPRLKCLRIV